MDTDLTELATTAEWQRLLTKTEKVSHAARGELLDLSTGDAERDAPDRGLRA